MDRKVSFRIPVYWYLTLRIIAREKGVKVSVLMRQAIREYLFPREQ